MVVIAPTKRTTPAARSTGQKPKPPRGRGRRSVRGDYDSTKDSPRRKAPSAKLLAEDDHLTPQERKKMLGGTRDLVRNFVICNWAVKKHLDFVSGFNFQALTPDKGFNRAFEQFIAARSTKESCDVAGRHPLRRMFRMAEARRVIDGDVAFLKLRDRSLQPIEGDRIRDPGTSEGWAHGVKTNAGGRALAYAIHRRTKSGFEMEREIAAEKLFWHACYETHHRFDAVRGVSPIAAAMNQYRDLYEGTEYATAKMKLVQSLGLIVTSNAAEGLGVHEVDTEQPGSDTEGQQKYKVSLGKGPFKMELEPGEDVKLLESGTPPTETQAFMVFCIAVAIKALDLPFCFWDEANTNFFGSKMAVTQYLQSAREKRTDVRDLYYGWTDWQLRMAMLPEFGDFDLPSGWELDDLLNHGYDWVPVGIPWLDQEKELRADIMAISAGMKTRSEVRRERFGDDWSLLPELLKAEEELITEAGINVTQAGPSVYDPSPVIAEK